MSFYYIETNYLLLAQRFCNQCATTENPTAASLAQSAALGNRLLATNRYPEIISELNPSMPKFCDICFRSQPRECLIATEIKTKFSDYLHKAKPSE